VKEIEDNILFLRKVVPGSSDKSYGIHVGKLAGLPMEIIDRAGEILLCLEEEKISDESISGILKKKKGSTSVYDLPLFKPLKEEARGNAVPFNAVQKTLEDHPLIKEIKRLDINSMTPLDALMKIVQWRKDLKEEA
jgi:DNA mismatch repair protein MutS